MNKKIALLALIFSTSYSYAYDDIPYEDNDNSFVVVPSAENSEQAGDKAFKIYEKVDVNEFAAPNCKDVPLSIDRCLPSICVDQEQFGKTYRKIKEKTTEGGCVYEERTQGLGGLNCKFLPENLSKLNKMFQVQYFGNVDVKLSDSEKTEFKNIMDSSCKIIKDNEISSTVSPSSPSQDISVPPIVVPTPEKETAIVPTTKVDTTPTTSDIKPQDTTQATETKKAEEPKAESDKEFTLKSVMFTPEEIAQINNIINNFGMEGIVTGEVDPKDTQVSGRRFYLNSLIFYTKDKWTLWINNLKISNDSRDDGLVIREISKEYAIIEWSTPNLETIAPDWRKRLTAISRNKFVSAKKDIEVFLPDETAAVVSFKLSPNQLFEVESMKILEGNKG